MIKQGAKLVEHADDIIEELNISQDALREDTNVAMSIDLTSAEKKVLDKLSIYPIHIDKLVRDLSFSAAEVSSLLLQLELKGLVSQSPGKFFSRDES